MFLLIGTTKTMTMMSFYLKFKPFVLQTKRVCLTSQYFASLINMNLSEKYLHAKEAPFMTKELHNAIMKRSRYRNKFLKDKSQISRDNHKIQRNLSKKLLRKTKKSYFESLNTKKLMDNRSFGKTVVPLFTNKASRGEKIILNEA